MFGNDGALDFAIDRSYARRKYRVNAAWKDDFSFTMTVNRVEISVDIFNQEPAKEQIDQIPLSGDSFDFADKAGAKSAVKSLVPQWNDKYIYESGDLCAIDGAYYQCNHEAARGNRYHPEVGMERWIKLSYDEVFDILTERKGL